MILFVYAVMEARFRLSPLIEPIGRKPYLKKWTGYRSALNGSGSKHRRYQFDDTYRYFIQVLETENLELAYKFRYTVEAAGSAPFIERQDQLDRALKRSKNKAFEPLENLLQQIQIELGLDYDQQSLAQPIRRPIVRESIKPDPELKDAISLYIPDITTPDNTDHHTPYGQYHWQQPPEETEEQTDDALVAADTELAAYARLKQAKLDNLIENQPTGQKEDSATDELLNQFPENLKKLSELSKEDDPIETLATPRIQTDKKIEPSITREDSSDIEAGELTTHVPSDNKKTSDQSSLQLKLTEAGYPKPEDIIQPDAEGSPESGLAENGKDKYQDSPQTEVFRESSTDSAKQNPERNSYATPPVSYDEEVQGPDTGTAFKAVIDRESNESADVDEERVLEAEVIKVAADKLVLPADESQSDIRGSAAEEISIKDTAWQTPSLETDKQEDLLNIESTKGKTKHCEEAFPESSDLNESVEQSEPFIKQSDSLKSYVTAESAKPDNEEFENDQETVAQPSSHDSADATQKEKVPVSADRSFMKALKSPIHHLKAKLNLKNDHPAVSEDGEQREHHPNIPKSKRKKLSLPFKVRKSSSSLDKKQVIEETREKEVIKKPVDYNLSEFRLAAESTKGSEADADMKGKPSEEKTREEYEKSLNDLKEYADPRIGLIQSRKEVILRIHKNRKNGNNGESDKPNWTGKPVVENSPPPPLYNFKFTLRKPIIHSTPDTYDHGTALVIFKDCIERRSETSSERRHFFAGSSTWNYFQKKNYRPFYQDTSSLVIQKDCIEHRIVHNPLPSKHTLELSSSEMETFKEFDSFYREPDEYEDSLYFSDNSDSSFDEVDKYSYVDPFEEENKAQAFHQKKREELYQSCLDRINQKEGLLFDFKAGKIAIDNTDKHEIERWVRAQQSESIEMYRTYAEAIMHPEIGSIKGVQDFVRSKLKKSDFPGQRVVDIFDKLKENSYSVELKRQDLVGILKRQDYVSVNSDSLSTTLSFSNSYSRYRAWRETVESPKIQVRTASAAEKRPIIPFESFRKRWSYLDTPKINVRSSSEYQFKRTIPVFDKISNWRKSHS